MILSMILIFSLLVTLFVYFFSGLITQSSDLWILLFSFFVGFIVGIIILVIYILVLSLFVSNKKENDKPKKIYLRTVKRACEFILMISGARVYIRGIENIPTDKKFLLVINHQSWFDAIVTVWTLRAYNVSFVMKDSLMKKFILGKYLKACAFISLNRENPREGIKTINKCVDKIANDDASIVIFPEGTRSRNYEMGEFHNGTFKIATKSQCPIVICALQNSWKVMKRFPFRKTKVYFDVVKIYNYDDYKEKTTQEISEYAHELIKNDLENLPKY